MKPNCHVFSGGMLAAILMAAASSVRAREITGTPGSPGATTSTGGKQLPLPDPKFGGVIKEKASESTPWWTPRVVPPQGAPNVLLIMTDDCGFGSPGISGDNGGSPEGMLNGTPNEFTTFNGIPVPVKAQLLWYPFGGSDKTFPHFAAPWAWAMDTPFKWTKQVASHFGGTAQGMCMYWPGHIKDVGGVRGQFHHMIDIAPTILEAAGIPLPDTINGTPQRPMDGVSMTYTWDKANANAPSTRDTQYFEMLGTIVFDFKPEPIDTSKR